MNWLV